MLSSPGTAGHSCLRRAISRALTPSQPPAHLHLVMSWPAPGLMNRALHRLEITSTMSQPGEILHGRGVRGGLGMNAFNGRGPNQGGAFFIPRIVLPRPPPVRGAGPPFQKTKTLAPQGIFFSLFLSQNAMETGGIPCMHVGCPS